MVAMTMNEGLIVSKAKDDLPEPETPVKTTSLSLGISTSTFFRLCTLAPLILIRLNATKEAKIYCRRARSFYSIKKYQN